jgi:T5SS/PEP-CTERM-associated repeat protein
MRGRRALAVAVLAGVALVAGASARGAGITRTWLAASDGNFSDGGNWSGTTAPGSDDTAIFDKTGTYKVTFTDTAGDVTTSFLRVSAGDVTFDLKPGSTSHTYNLTDTGTTINSGTLVGNADNMVAGLNISGGTLSGAHAVIASKATSTGTVNISGTGSKWSLSGNVYVGYSGNGMLNVADKGAYSNTGNLYIANSSGSSGDITVDGDGSTFTTGGFYGGSAGSGSLEVTNKGTVSSGTTYLGRGGNFVGLVDGDGSVWNTGALSVGYSTSGTLNITDGGLVSASSRVSIAGNSGSTGALSVTGENARFTNSRDLNVGGSTAPGGTGSLTIGGGGSVTTSPSYDLTVWSSGTVDLQGDSTITTPNVNVVGGLIKVSGLNNEIEGDATLDSSSTLQMTLDGTDDYGQLGGSGTLTAGGLFKVVLGDFNPVAGNTFHVLNWKTISGTFATVDLQPLSGGLSWDQGGLYSTGYITVAPEPGMLGMLAAGGMMLAVRRRRGTLRQT